MTLPASVPVMANQHRIVRVLHHAGAVSASTARELEELGLRDSFVLGGLIRRGVVIRTPDGRVHLDPERVQHWRSTRRRRALLLTLLVLGALILWKFLRF